MKSLETHSNSPYTYDFDIENNRKNTNSVKWNVCSGEIGAASTDLLPMWVADMDFISPREVISTMTEIAQHGIFGYSDVPHSCFQAVVDWCANEYGWNINQQSISLTPGVMTGANIAIRAFTNPTDEVILQPPVYAPFFSSIKNNGREVIHNPLVMANGRYTMDFSNLAESITNKTRMILLSNPHNPVGRVWDLEELEQLATIVLKHDLLVFSDEIHSDIILQDKKHIPFASLSREIALRTITGIAPSKTFNIAGLKTSFIIIQDKSKKTLFDEYQEKIFGLYNANIFGVAAAESAYRHGKEWLIQVLSYIKKNAEFTCDYFQRELPELKTYVPEGTFLMWLDFTDLQISHEALWDIIVNNSGVVLNNGIAFGESGAQHMRINIGCPRSILREGLSRIKKAVSEFRSQNIG